MLYYDRINVSEGIDANKTCESKKRDICHYWYFLNKGFKFQLNVYNRCHDLVMMLMNLSDIANLNINSADYHCIISGIRKSDPINLMQNIDLTEKCGTLYNMKIYYHLSKWVMKFQRLVTLKFKKNIPL